MLSPGTSGVAYTNQSQAAPTTYSIEAWVKTSSFNGGKILGYEDVQTGWGVNYDRQIYMTNNGRIAYGIKSGGVNQVITSTVLYNDNVYHHIVATQGASGMALYVDGVLIGTNATVTPDAYNGYWRLGGGNLTGWPNAPASSALVGSSTRWRSTRRRSPPLGSPPTTTPTPWRPPPPRTSTPRRSRRARSRSLDGTDGHHHDYNVYRDGALAGSPTGTTFTDSGRTGNTPYSYTSPP